MQEPFIYEVAGALVPVILIAAMIAIVWLIDAIRAAYALRQDRWFGPEHRVSEAARRARTCDYCKEVKPYALLPTDPLHQRWACMDCHEYWSTVEAAHNDGWDGE